MRNLDASRSRLRSRRPDLLLTAWVKAANPHARVRHNIAPCAPSNDFPGRLTSDTRRCGVSRRPDIALTMTRADPPSAAAAMATNSAHELDGTDASISAASPVAGYGSTSTSSAQPRPTSSAPVPPPDAESENDDEAPDTRPAWRQPNPLWILPFTFLLTLSLGMTLAPRPQLLINLACVAHPPLAREGGALDGGGVDSGVGLVVTGESLSNRPSAVIAAHRGAAL